MIVNDTDIWDLNVNTRAMEWHHKAKAGASEALMAIYQERKDTERLMAAQEEAERIKAIAAEAERISNLPYTPVAHDAEGIVRNVLKHRKVSMSRLLGKGRKPEVVRVRREIAYWLRMRTELSLPQIAWYIGIKNHTSVLYLIQKHVMLHNLPQPPSGYKLYDSFDPSIAKPTHSIAARIMRTAK